MLNTMWIMTTELGNRVSCGRMAAFRFQLEARDDKTSARAGNFRTDHGEVRTPIFMPVGTAATENRCACGSSIVDVASGDDDGDDDDGDSVGGVEDCLDGAGRYDRHGRARA